MAMTDTDGDGGDIEAVEPSGTVESVSPTPSTELARRPAGTVDLPEHGRHRPSARDTVRAATGVAKVAVTAAGAVTAWSVDTALGVGAAVVRGSIAGTPTRRSSPRPKPNSRARSAKPSVFPPHRPPAGTPRCRHCANRARRC